MKKMIVVVLAFCFIALPVLVEAQTPAGVHVMLPASGANYVQSTAMSGTLTSRGITFTWDVQDFSATLTVSGTYATEWISPSFDIYWFSTPDNLPMSIHVTSNTDSAYDFEAPYNTGSWITDLNQNDFVGNFDFGFHYPACSRFDITINPDVEGAAYDMSVSMDWGVGTADDVEAWDSVKALYR